MKATRTARQMKSGKLSSEARKGNRAALGGATAVRREEVAREDPTAAVEGDKARRRLDRPAPKRYAAGGAVGGRPIPSLRQATLGIDVEHPAYDRPRPDKPDAPGVAQAKGILQGPDAWRLSDDEIKSIGDYIISQQRPGRAEHKHGGRVSSEGGAGSGVGRLDESDRARRRTRPRA